MAKSKNFGRNFFWSESIQNVLKRILKRKSRNRKFFPITKLFLGLSHFLAKIVKKWLDQKILKNRDFLAKISNRIGGIARSIEPAELTTKSNEKNFTQEKIFDFEIFVLKYDSHHSESIPTKKNFDQNFLPLSFFHYLIPSWDSAIF